jgi:hypothetical protein
LASEGSARHPGPAPAGDRAPAESNSGPLKRVFDWLRGSPWPRSDKGGKDGPTDGTEEKPDPWLRVSARRKAVKIEVASPPAAGGEGKKATGDAAVASDGVGAVVLKAAGAVATGIGATGAVIVVGAGILWIRFTQAGLPATQAVSVLPKYEPLVQGAQHVIVFVLIALAAVLMIYLTDPKGHVRRITLGVLIGLTAGAILYTLLTQLGPGAKLALAGLAVGLAVVCVLVGLITSDRFWPLALSVFGASLVFSASCTFFTVEQQDFVQGIAVLRGAADRGFTGIYVTATDSRVYFGQPAPIRTAEGLSEKSGLFEVKRADDITFAVGPLESQEDAARRANAMLAQLIENRSINPPPPPPPAAKGGAAGGAEGGSTGGAGASSAGAGDAGSPPRGPIEGGAQLFDAFVGQATLHHKIDGKARCLVRYAEISASAPAGHWWTSCGEAKTLGKVLEVKEALALPGRFRAVYDERVKVKLPADGKLTYLEGVAASQCEHEKPLPCGFSYKGGGVQLYVFEPDALMALAKGKPEVLCTDARQDLSSDWRLESCLP